MKKIVVLIMFVTLNLLSYSKGLNVKLGNVLVEKSQANFSTKNNQSIDSDDSYENGIVNLELSYEFEFKEKIELGFGGFISQDEANPIFFSAKFLLDEIEKTERYYILKLGAISSNQVEKDISQDTNYDIESNNFVYLAAGVGIEENNFIIEFSCEALSGKISYTDFDIDADLLITRVNVCVGYNFELPKMQIRNTKNNEINNNEIS